MPAIVVIVVRNHPSFKLFYILSRLTTNNSKVLNCSEKYFTWILIKQFHWSQFCTKVHRIKSLTHSCTKAIFLAFMESCIGLYYFVCIAAAQNNQTQMSIQHTIWLGSMIVTSLAHSICDKTTRMFEIDDSM